jgi:hypothetical protein
LALIDFIFQLPNLLLTALHVRPKLLNLLLLGFQGLLHFL